MTLIWHIIRKDLLRFRVILLAWGLLLAAKYLFLSSITGIFGHPSLYWLKQFEFPTPFYLAVVFLPAGIAFFLVAALLFEDPPAGRDPFWVTRPISGAQLFAAKFLFAFLMFVLVPLVAALAWWLACGFGAEQILPMARFMGSAYLSIVLLGLGMASLTDGYPRYFVWTLAGLAVVLIAHLFALTFGLGHTAQMPPVFYNWLPAVCVAVLSVEIAWQRFVVRHFRRSLPIVATLTLAGSAWLFTFPPAALGRLFAPAARAFPDEAGVRVTVAGDVRTFLKGGLSLPLRIDGLPDNSVPIIWMEATWRSPDGKIWTVRGSSGGSHQPLRRAAWQLLQVTHDESHSLVQLRHLRHGPEVCRPDRQRKRPMSKALSGFTPTQPGSWPRFRWGQEASGSTGVPLPSAITPKRPGTSVLSSRCGPRNCWIGGGGLVTWRCSIGAPGKSSNRWCRISGPAARTCPATL